MFTANPVEQNNTISINNSPDWFQRVIFVPWLGPGQVKAVQYLYMFLPGYMLNMTSATGYFPDISSLKKQPARSIIF